MNYNKVLDYLYSKLPMFQRIGAAAYKNDLSNTLKFCEILGNPETKFKTIHVAGTNGKGSTSHALASIFQEHGYKTGLYTSPHLVDFRERIRINGQMIAENNVIDFVHHYKEDIDSIQPSFFETTVAMAFDYFANQNVDIAIIETGLGGRLDSTNVIIPEVSVITNISYDHTDLLGETLAEIANEKAGIIKPGVPVVIGETQTETSHVFIEKAKSCGSDIYFADENSQYFNTEILTDLKGDYQQKNMTTVMQTVEILIKLGYPLSKFKVAKGLQNIKTNTGLKGRWEIISNQPFIVADTGHNEAGIALSMHELSKVNYDKLYFVFGVVREKITSKLWHHLPKSAYYFFCTPSIPRGRDDKDLFEEAQSQGFNGESCGTVENAYNKAISIALSKDAIFIGGSTFVVADFFLNHEK